jgi:hypothetical protein
MDHGKIVRVAITYEDRKTLFLSGEQASEWGEMYNSAIDYFSDYYDWPDWKWELDPKVEI